MDESNLRLVQKAIDQWRWHELRTLLCFVLQVFLSFNVGFCATTVFCWCCTGIMVWFSHINWNNVRMAVQRTGFDIDYD